MGAWGTGVFQSDEALDFVNEVVDGIDLSTIETAVDRVLQVKQEYLDSPEAEQALASAAILALLKHRDAQVGDGTPELNEWIARVKIVPAEDLLEKARKAVERILTDPSELLELWKDSENFDNWKASTERLAAQL